MTPDIILMSDGEIVKDRNVEEILIDKKLLEANGMELPLCMQGMAQKGL